MTVRELVLQDHSSENTAEVCLYIDDDPERFRELMDCFLDPDQELARRAAWALGKILEDQPQLANVHLDDLVGVLHTPGLHDAVVRATVRSLQFVVLDEEYWGEIWDGCAQLLIAAKTSIAVKVFAMSTLYRLVEELPELKDELIFMIEEQFPFGSAGFRNRGEKILQALKRI